MMQTASLSISSLDSFERAYLLVIHAVPAIGVWLFDWRLPLLSLGSAAIGYFLAKHFITRRASRQRIEMEHLEESQRIMNALSDQRVVRLQNEALTDEILERKKMEAKLIHAAFHDPVTGLHNRAYLSEKLTAALGRVHGRSRFQAAILYIDLDHFKSVNDMLGHRMGDLLLIEVAKRLQSFSREKDTLARMGGDEFTILLENLQSTEQAFRMAQRVLTIIEEPIALAGMVFPMTASIGLCELNHSYTEADDILRDADTAMYCAKREGGARAVIYQTSMHEDASAAMQVKLQLKAAIDNDEFELFYQPLIDMRDRSIYGMEALIRWNHPSKGLLGPGVFIDLAEETGHILAIGAWVLRQACLDFLKLQKMVDYDLLMTVNVSTRQLDEANFFSELCKLLKETGVKPEMLQLEITESIFLKDAARIGKLFKEIRALGVRIAFDDFGTGYSSLSYLGRYPVDTLKIDQSFVQKITSDAVNADLVQLVIHFAETIGMSVSAEGVEEQEQAAALIEYGCTVAQGYLYSKPVPLPRMQEMLVYGIDLRRPQLTGTR